MRFLTGQRTSCTQPSCSIQRMTLAARSRHTGGVQSALCDGSVRFFSENIDRLTWRRLGSSQDGQVIGEF